MGYLAAGRVAPVPRGEWSSTYDYNKLDIVSWNNKTYIARKPSRGMEPIGITNQYWFLCLEPYLIDMVGCTESNDGIHGTVPTPLAGDQDKTLQGNGHWGKKVQFDLVKHKENKDDPDEPYEYGYMNDDDEFVSFTSTKILLPFIIDTIYPINSIYISTNNINPSEIFPNTTWEPLSDGYLRNNAESETGGSMTTSTIKLKGTQIPAHTHTATTQSTGAHAHTLTTQSTGAHTHTAITQSAGIHTHTATTQSMGAHTHTGATKTNGGKHKHRLYGIPYGSGSYPFYTPATYSSRNDGMYTAEDGAHTHNITTSSAGIHTHTLTTQSTGAHTHTLTTQSTGAHTHTATTQSTGAHTHTLTTSTNTLGNNVANEGHNHTLEPSYVRIYAFKRTA